MLLLTKFFQNNMKIPLIFLVLTLSPGTNGKCPSGAVQGPSGGDCFLYRTERATWFQAEEDCIGQFGHLASVTDAFVNAFLPRFACAGGSDEDSADYWLGGSKGVSSLDWSWSDGADFGYTNWALGKKLTITTESSYPLAATSHDVKAWPTSHAAWDVHNLSLELFGPPPPTPNFQIVQI